MDSPDDYLPISKLWIAGKPPHIRMRARLCDSQEVIEYQHRFASQFGARRTMEAFAVAEQIHTEDWSPVYYQPSQHKLPETDLSYTRNTSGKYVVPAGVGTPDYGIVPELHCFLDLDSLPAFEDNARAELALHFPRIIKHAPRNPRPSRMDIAHVEWRLRMGWLT